MAERVIKGYEPDSMFGFFEDISAIPRGSGNEGGIADYLVKFAAERGLFCVRDAANNVFTRSWRRRGATAILPCCFRGIPIWYASKPLPQATILKRTR